MISLFPLDNYQMYLSIIHMNRVTMIRNWFHEDSDVAFPKLESLKIECMLSLETWIDVFNYDDFPFLSTLIIKQCPKLISLPFFPRFQMLRLLEISHCTVLKCLPERMLPASLETLIIDDCPFLKRRCSKEGEDWHKVKHIPNVWIDLHNICSTEEDDGFEDNSSRSEDIYSTDEDVSEDILLSAGLNSRYVTKDGNDPTILSSKVSSAPLTLSCKGEILQSSNLRKFSFSEVKSATRNFRRDALLREGGFGSVFKGWIDENSHAPTKPGTGMVIAVKLFNKESYKGHQEWLAEVNYLGKLHHPNLVKLIGYCLEDEHRLLVYEFMSKGSLEDQLFRRHPEPLSWNQRMKVALGAAKGVAFLHNSERTLICRDFKTSNIFLDSSFTAKLSDFGFAKDGPTAVSTLVMGSYGYAAPEYISTGHLTTKSNVYSFGVVLLEMLSGRRAVDRTRPSGEHNLVEWARPFITKKRKIIRIMDPRLEGQYSLDAAFRVSALAFQCLSAQPRSGPSMTEVVEELEKLQDSSKEALKPLKTEIEKEREQLQDPSKEAHSSSSTGAHARRCSF